jgi:hypothetical protein
MLKVELTSKFSSSLMIQILDLIICNILNDLILLTCNLWLVGFQRTVFMSKLYHEIISNIKCIMILM